MSEPTVSSHIRALERVVGTTLIDRRAAADRSASRPRDGSSCTPLSTVFQTLDQGLESIRSISASARRTITVGAGPHFGGFILPQLIESIPRSIIQMSPYAWRLVRTSRF